MNRYTQKADGRWTIRPDALTPSQPGYTGEAADRLAALEELIYSLLKEQDELSESLAQLREQGRTVSRDTLIQRVWNVDFEGDERMVDRHVASLRQKLGGAAQHIRSVYGVGYRLGGKEAF